MLRRMLKLRRRPQETAMDFNKRTAASIGRWMKAAGVQTIYCKTIKAVYKSAWRVYNFRLDDGSCPLQLLREYRNQGWWDTVCFLSEGAKRQKTGTQHSHRGQQSAAWDNPFLTAWGSHWTDKLRECSTMKEWMNGYVQFATTLALKWGLPIEPESGLERGREDPDFLRTFQLPTSIEDVPPWLPHRKRFVPRACLPRLLAGPS